MTLLGWLGRKTSTQSNIISIQFAISLVNCIETLTAEDLLCPWWKMLLFCCVYRVFTKSSIAVIHPGTNRWLSSWKSQLHTKVAVKAGFHSKAVKVIYIYLYSVTLLPLFSWLRPEVSTIGHPADPRKKPVQRRQRHIAILPWSGDDDGVISFPTAATKCSVNRVFHEIKHCGHPSMTYVA